MIVHFRDVSIDLKANVVRTVCNTKTGVYYKQYNFHSVSEYIFINDIACYSALQCLEAFAKGDGHPFWEEPPTELMIKAQDAIAEWILLNDKD